MLFLTTNHPERLDSALVRPGRVDRKIELGFATPDQARRLFLWFYRDSGVNTSDLRARPIGSRLGFRTERSVWRRSRNTYSGIAAIRKPRLTRSYLTTLPGQSRPQSLQWNTWAP